MLGEVNAAVLFAPILWRICQRSIGNTNFQLWSGAVFGRAYAVHGRIDDALTYEFAPQDPDNDLPVQDIKTGAFSRKNIINYIYGLLQVNDAPIIGAAERVLRRIVTRAEHVKSLGEYELFIPDSMFPCLLWPLTAPTESEDSSKSHTDHSDTFSTFGGFLQWMFQARSAQTQHDPILDTIAVLLDHGESFAERLFPFLLHLFLLNLLEKASSPPLAISDKFRKQLQHFLDSGQNASLANGLINALLYLQSQPYPRETTKADRIQWLDVDYEQAATAAVRCGMFKTGLLFLEIEASQKARVEASSSRRSSTRKLHEDTVFSTDALLEIYQSLDEQDAFYGIRQPSSLHSMMSRLEYEKAGFKALSFRGALFDSQIRGKAETSDLDTQHLVQVLEGLNLAGLSQSLLGQSGISGPKSIDAALQTARKLEKWDVQAPSTHVSSASVTFRVFQSLNVSADISQTIAIVSAGVRDLTNHVMSKSISQQAMNASLAGLAALSETSEILCPGGRDKVTDTIKRLSSQEDWMQLERCV